MGRQSLIETAQSFADGMKIYLEGMKQRLPREYETITIKKIYTLFVVEEHERNLGD